MQKINRWAQEDDKLWAPSQYENEYNYRSHIRWTGPQLLKQLPNISVFCAGMGSAGNYRQRYDQCMSDEVYARMHYGYWNLPQGA